ncbi:hypothetical protein BH20ACT3_BH20ACT3_01970 [soil metagenome]
MDDLRWTAELHARELPDGFFVSFGLRFLAAYHGRFLASPVATVMVIGSAGSTCGFLVGTFDNTRHYHWLLRNGAPMVSTGLLSVCTRPRLAADLLCTRVLRYGRAILRQVSPRAWRRPPGAANAAKPPVIAVVTHIAVDPGAQGLGLGRLLIERFAQDAREAGAEEIRLITRVDTRGPGFYRRLGWQSLGQRVSSSGSIVEEFRIIP